MAVTETFRALGQWGLKVRSDTPRTITDSLDYFGHIVIGAGRDDPRIAGDSLLTSGRYVGVLRSASNSSGNFELSGVGMAFWLGDEDQKGSVIESPVSFTSSTFTNAVRSLLPSSGSVTEGTLFSVAGSYTGSHVYQSPRQAIDYVCDLFGADWRVNGNGTLDAGIPANLFVTTPQTAIISRDSGLDMSMRALPGLAKLDEDVEDFSTRVVLLAQGSEASVATGSADIAGGLNPYKDIHGNTVKLTRLVSESGTDQGNASARAQLQLNRFTSPRDAVTLNSTTHDIRGDLAVGDYVWVHDQDAGLFDLNNEIVLRGERLNPVKLRVTALTWPVERGMGVYYRTPTGTWLDLTDYVVFESGQTNITVGGYNRSLTNTGTEPVGSRPQPNTSIPATPVFTTPFAQSVYQSANSGITKAQVQLVWTQPLNADGTAIIDGDRYEIRYRTSTVPVFPSTWSQVAGKTWSQLATWDQPITFIGGPWQYTAVGWDSLTFLVQELTPGVPYEFQIRAVDNATPANFSAWSASTAIQTNGDVIAPQTPAVPTVASSRIAVQITHLLGASSGGTFNLAADLHHLEVHGQYEPLFTPTDSTLLGKLIANNGMILGQIPAVGTFQIESTSPVYIKVIAVDEAGNKSGASVAASATAQLIDDAHISDLTVSKVTAGTVTSNWVQAGDFRTATAGARAGFNGGGFYAYNANEERTFDVVGATGDVTIKGTLRSGTTGNRVVVNPDPGFLPRIDMYSGSPFTRHVTMVEFDETFLMQREDDGTRAANGGWLQFQEDAAFIGHRSPFVSDSYIEFAGDGGISFKGFFSPGAGFVDPMMFVGEAGPFNAPSAVAFSYGITLTNAARVIPGILGPSDAFVRISAENTTGFTGQVSAGVGVIFRFIAWR